MNISNIQRQQLEKELNNKLDDLEFTVQALQNKSVKELKDIIIDIGIVKTLQTANRDTATLGIDPQFPAATAEFIEQRIGIDIGKYGFVGDHLTSETYDAIRWTNSDFAKQVGFRLLSESSKDEHEWKSTINWAFRKSLMQHNELLEKQIVEMQTGWPVLITTDIIKDYLIDYLAFDKKPEMAEDILANYNIVIDEMEERSLFFNDKVAYANPEIFNNEAIKYTDGDILKWRDYEFHAGEGMKESIFMALDGQILNEAKANKEVEIEPEAKAEPKKRLKNKM